MCSMLVENVELFESLPWKDVVTGLKWQSVSFNASKPENIKILIINYKREKIEKIEKKEYILLKREVVVVKKS